MAYDKVVDSSVLNAGLKAIADAIREKAGTTGNLAFPTAMAEAIASIEAGGKFVIGSTIVTEDTEISSQFWTNHIPVPFEGIPNVYAFFCPTAEVKSGQKYAKAGILVCGDTGNKDTYLSVVSGMSSATDTSWGKMASDNSVLISQSGGKYQVAQCTTVNGKRIVRWQMRYSGDLYMEAGKEYLWCFGLVEG